VHPPGGHPARESSLKNLYESKPPPTTSQTYNQQSERGAEVQDSRRRPTRGSKTDREWARWNEEEEDFGDSAESPQTSDRRRAPNAGANVAIQRRDNGGPGWSRIPVPAGETVKEKGLRSSDDPRSWPDEPERDGRLSQETLLKATQTTMLPYRTTPEGRSKDSSQQQDVYRDHDRYGAERGLSSGLNRRRRDDDPDPDSDPDPDQPSTGGTIGFSPRHPGSRSFQENTLGTSARRRPEGRHSPDPEPDQPNQPYGFSADDAQAQDSQLRSDVRHRGDSRSRVTPPETERSGMGRPAGPYHTSQRDVIATSKDRRPERPADVPHRYSTQYTSSGTKKDDKDIYDRHKRQG
jgi:hypothetical protein